MGSLHSGQSPPAARPESTHGSRQARWNGWAHGSVEQSRSSSKPSRQMGLRRRATDMAAAVGEGAPVAPEAPRAVCPEKPSPREGGGQGAPRAPHGLLASLGAAGRGGAHIGRGEQLQRDRERLTLQLLLLPPPKPLLLVALAARAGELAHLARLPGAREKGCLWFQTRAGRGGRGRSRLSDELLQSPVDGRLPPREARLGAAPACADAGAEGRSAAVLAASRYLLARGWSPESAYGGGAHGTPLRRGRSMPPALRRGR